MLLPSDSPVIQDLLAALQDEELTDVTLEGHDGVPIPACRFVLAARSTVLRRMLYGSFLESSSNRILLQDYDSVVLEAIVEYCYRNEISKFRLYIHRTAASARRLVQLYKAADYLALMGLARLVAQMAHNLTTRYPPLACAVYDEADLSSKVSHDALEMIQCRPYVTLPPDAETNGGISCLSRHKLVSIYRDLDVQAGELFLFDMLQEWLNCMRVDEEDGHDEPVNSCPFATVQACASHLVLENIEPHELLTLVSPSGFCQPTRITDAITQQALKACHTRVWSLSSRGPDCERILVEGAGSKNANGIYYRIDGLANGELYSKREISCGQQYVYTLSISLNKTIEEVECRIFYSKLLTHNAVRLLATGRNKSGSGGGRDLPVTAENNLQPILQVLFMGDDNANNNGRGTNATVKSSGEGAWLCSPFESHTRIQLSDGDHSIYAVLTPKLRKATRTKELVQNTLIKVLEYEKCANTVLDGDGDRRNEVYIKLTKISIISQDPGHKFGNPVYYYDVCDYEEDEDEGYASSVSSSILDESHEPAVVITHPDTPIVRTSDIVYSRTTQQLPLVSESQALHELYYCQYQIRDKPIDSKVPNTAWEVDSHGVDPGPKCRWIPSTSPSQEESSDELKRHVPNSTLSPNRMDGRSSPVQSKSASVVGLPPPRTSSFNAFAASVLPLPIQSRYSLAFIGASSNTNS